MGVLIIRTLLLGVYIRGLDFWKLPCSCCSDNLNWCGRYVVFGLKYCSQRWVRFDKDPLLESDSDCRDAYDNSQRVVVMMP